MRKAQLILGLAITCMIAFMGCSQPKPINTIKNLHDGINGESNASKKYEAFAAKAKEEGFVTVAALFDAASKAEAIHAANHKKVLEQLGGTAEVVYNEFEIKTTAENLQAAIAGESYEVATMYPQFLADAKAEKVKKAEQSFNWANDTEKKHNDFYTKALNALNAGTQAELPVSYAVCPVCGNTYDAANTDEKCAFCQTEKGKFFTFN
jgi:rubrerythrin